MTKTFDVRAVAELQPGWDAEWSRPGSVGYDALIDSMGVKQIAGRDFGDYQGDTIALVGEGDRYGLLVFGWGSCSGCDALEGCDTWDEVNALAQQLYDSIKWADSRTNVALLATDPKNRNDWYVWENDAARFLDEIATWAISDSYVFHKGEYEEARIEYQY